MFHYKELAVFAGGVLFGSAGFKLLASRDAKKVYTHAAAAGLRMKESVMETVTSVQENAADILASARDINEARAAREDEEVADCSGLPLLGETVCNYDEGFIAGILSSYTGKEYSAVEVDCWATGDRVCRFRVEPEEKR